jgi:Tol biopolymer transport system component
VAFSGSDGLYVRDLAAGTSVRLPATNQNDYHPLWSPSGDRLAFVRGAGAFDVFVIGADGSGMIQVTSAPEYEELAGWTPDGQHLVYSAVIEAGTGVLRQVDLASGATEDLIHFDGRVKSVGAAISPDGQRVVYRDVLFGNPSGGLYLSRLDGSERRLVARLGMGGLSSPVWGPDGAWLAARLPEANSPVPVAVLIQPDRCQVVVLSGLKGEVFGWAP